LPLNFGTPDRNFKPCPLQITPDEQFRHFRMMGVFHGNRFPVKAVAFHQSMHTLILFSASEPKRNMSVAPGLFDFICRVPFNIMTMAVRATNFCYINSFPPNYFSENITLDIP